MPPQSWMAGCSLPACGDRLQDGFRPDITMPEACA